MGCGGRCSRADWSGSGPLKLRIGKGKGAEQVCAVRGSLGAKGGVRSAEGNLALPQKVERLVLVRKHLEKAGALRSPNSGGASKGVLHFGR